jgi:hypothetical protein
MFDPSKKRFSKNSLRLVVLLLFCAASIVYFLIPRAAQVQTPEEEPIAYIGHGAMFDKHGTEIAPTPKFIRQAQEWYMADLLKKLGKNQQAQFSKLKQEMTTNLAVDEQSQLVLNSSLMDWLIERAEVKDRDRLKGKNNLLKRYLKRKLSDNPDPRAPSSNEKFQVDQKLLERIKTSTQLKVSKNEPVRERRLPVLNAVWLDNERKPGAGLFWNAAFAGSPQPDPGAEAVPTLTTNGGLNYRNECLAAGVPVPPDFGPTSAWVDRGLIPRNELFIEADKAAMVRVFSSSSPRGMCIALPRFFLEGEDDSPGSGADFRDNEVDLDGVICLGETGNVCFWDNEKNGTPITPAFDLGSSVSFSNFGGGSELRASAGGICSDCHAGENPYIIHGAVLESLDDPPSAAGDPPALPTFAPSWHNPIVTNSDASSWPENPGPMNSPASCVGCHGTAAAGSFAGRLPHLSPAVRGYCGSVLRAAVGTKSFASQGPLPTMPQGNEGGLACTPNLPPGNPNFSWSSPAVRPCTPQMTESCSVTSLLPADPLFVACTPQLKALLDWCGVPATGDASGRGDPHITTFNGINYDFQGAGEFVHLRSANGLEIQTRQTPVSSAGGIPPDGYTGLASCVSVITAVAARVGKRRVTFTGGRERNDLVLRVDGKEQKLGKKPLNLGGGGRIFRVGTGNNIEIDFPDGTRLIVTSNWWTDQGVWYMNVDVLNTHAREGIMGSINPTGWLPALPDGIPMGPMPVSLTQRYIDLNQKFADAWRVTNATSLFDYAPGTSTATFTDRSWPPDRPPCIAPSGRPPANPMDKKKAAELCRPIRDRAMRAQCMFDVTVTGEPGFAANYLVTQSLVP